MQNLEKKLRDEFHIQFADMDLLVEAFTHKSYANEHRLLKTSNNERLEFLGDAVLGLVISEYLFKNYPDKPESDLSKMKASIVQTQSLAGFSRDLGFDRFLRLAKGEEKNGGRTRDTNLENLFEAFLGALILDQGFEVAKRFIYDRVIPEVADERYVKVEDYKTALQEAVQTQGNVEITYQVVDTKGPDHERVFTTAVLIDGIEQGRGSGRSKKIAEQAAAKNAIKGQINVSQAD